MSTKDDTTQRTFGAPNLAISDRGYESELRSESIRWRWSMAGWEQPRSEPLERQEQEQPELVLIELIDDEVLLVLPGLDMES